MKDFTLPRRDFEIKCGLLALILIRTVLQASLQSSNIVGIGSESIVGNVM